MQTDDFARVFAKNYPKACDFIEDVYLADREVADAAAKAAGYRLAGYRLGRAVFTTKPVVAVRGGSALPAADVVAK